MAGRTREEAAGRALEGPWFPRRVGAGLTRRHSSWKGLREVGKGCKGNTSLRGSGCVSGNWRQGCEQNVWKTEVLREGPERSLS